MVPVCLVENENAKKKRKSRNGASVDNSALVTRAPDNADFVANAQPLHIVSSWIEPGTTTRRMTVATFLPSGVSIGQFSVQVANDGCALKFKMIWPGALVNLVYLHLKWLQSNKDDAIIINRLGLNIL